MNRVRMRGWEREVDMNRVRMRRWGKRGRYDQSKNEEVGKER